MLQKVNELERAILETVYDEGSVGISNGSLTPASQVLKAKYPSEREQQAVTVTLQYLLEKRICSLILMTKEMNLELVVTPGE